MCRLAIKYIRDLEEELRQDAWPHSMATMSTTPTATCYDAMHNVGAGIAGPLGGHFGGHLGGHLTGGHLIGHLQPLQPAVYHGLEPMSVPRWSTV